MRIKYPKVCSSRKKKKIFHGDGMNAHEILYHIKAENVRLVLLENDKIDVSGDKIKVGKLLPFIRDHKTEIVNILSGESETKIKKSMSPTLSPKTGESISPVALERLQGHR